MLLTLISGFKPVYKSFEKKKKDEGMSESSVETREKTLVPRLIWTGGLKSVDTLRGSWSSMLQR